MLFRQNIPAYRNCIDFDDYIYVNCDLQENKNLFKASEESDAWKAYVLYADDMVIEGFFLAVECSLKFFLHQTETKNGLASLFQAHLELNSPDMVFKLVFLW